MASCVAVPATIGVVVEAVQKLTGQIALELASTDVKRDLPSAQRRAAFVHALAELSPDQRIDAAAGIRAVATVLLAAAAKGDVVALVEALHLHAAIIPWTDVDAAVAAVAELIKTVCTCFFCGTH
jgi:hypothetical protein